MHEAMRQAKSLAVLKAARQTVDGCFIMTNDQAPMTNQAPNSKSQRSVVPVGIADSSKE
jgi:hypothetical protein